MFIKVLLCALSAKNFQELRNVTIKNSEFEKKVTSFRPKKHQEENNSEASHFLSTKFHNPTKPLEPLKTIKNQYMFLQIIEKRTRFSLTKDQLWGFH